MDKKTYSPELTIRPFTTGDQAEVKMLILAGLVEHWGWLDPDKNLDLNDIASSYATGLFLTARFENRLLGTGAIIPEGAESGRIVRMSVSRSARRQGVGGAILDGLIRYAKDHRLQTIVLETTSTWQDAISFYKNQGFTITGEQDGDTHFILKL